MTDTPRRREPRADVSVITTVYNEIRSIDALLASYGAQRVVGRELVIVDGGSTDGTAARIEAFARQHPELGVRLIVDPTCTRRHTIAPIARGRNVAIRAAAASRIACTDGGCVLEPGWLEALVAGFDAGGEVVSGSYRPTGSTAFQRSYGALIERALSGGAAARYPSSRSIAFTRAAWEAVGGYPELSFAGEDTLFDQRLHDAGFRFVDAPGAIVEWEVPSTAAEAFHKHFEYGRGDARTRFRFAHNLAKIPLMVAPLHVVTKPHWLARGTIFYGYMCGFLRGTLAS